MGRIKITKKDRKVLSNLTEKKGKHTGNIGSQKGKKHEQHKSQSYNTKERRVHLLIFLSNNGKNMQEPNVLTIHNLGNQNKRYTKPEWVNTKDIFPIFKEYIVATQFYKTINNDLKEFEKERLVFFKKGKSRKEGDFYKMNYKALPKIFLQAFNTSRACQFTQTAFFKKYGFKVAYKFLNEVFCDYKDSFLLNNKANSENIKYFKEISNFAPTLLKIIISGTNYQKIKLKKQVNDYLEEYKSPEKALEQVYKHFVVVDSIIIEPEKKPGQIKGAIMVKTNDFRFKKTKQEV